MKVFSLTSKQRQFPHVVPGNECGHSIEADDKDVKQGGVRSQDDDGCLLGTGRTPFVVDPLEAKGKEEDAIHQRSNTICIRPIFYRH